MPRRPRTDSNPQLKPAKFSRSITLPASLWYALDQDARRCLRNSTGHLNAILSELYLFEDTRIDKDKIESIKKQLKIVTDKKPA